MVAEEPAHLGSPKPGPSMMLQVGVPFTLTVKLQEAELPQPSVAGQVIVVTPTGYGSVNGKASLRLHTTGIAPSQLSLAVGGVKLTGAPSQTMMLPGQPVNTGAVRSSFQR